MRLILLALTFLSVSAAQDVRFEELLEGNLDRWEVRGDGHWDLRSDGVLIGYRHPELPVLRGGDDATLKRIMRGWRLNQSWLYTKKSYTNFDLRLEFWADPTLATAESRCGIRRAASMG